MKLAILSVFVCTLSLCAQEKPAIPEGLRLSPTPMVTQGIQQVLPRPRLEPNAVPGTLELKGKIPTASKVCSVPLLEAHADANDPGIAMKPWNGSAPMRRAVIPAPACEK